ncbi:MAG: HIT domain-containing protein [Mariprofundaceae bacterium]|nr:HIT domain-containing protein [Mariprofundaceae bacterium]
MILHPQLKADCIELGQLSLCTVLLMPDAHYPWLILVPQRENIRDIYDLSDGDQQQLMRESCFVAKTLADMFDADKINVASLGNIVPQLHIHHIVRYHHDVSWPAPVWGAKPAKLYEAKSLDKRCQAIQKALKLT